MSENELPAGSVPLWLNKIDVAARQVRVAVRLHFDQCDPIALHTLVAAAHGIVADLAKASGTPSTVEKLPRVARFLQQAEVDPADKLNVEPLPALTEELLFDAAGIMQRLMPVERVPFEAKVYFAWFLCTRPDLFQNCGPAMSAIMRDNQHLAKMSLAEVRELLRFNQVLDTSEPLPQWAILGPGPLTSRALQKQKGAGEQGKEKPAESNPSEGAREPPGRPSAEYLEGVRAFENIVRECSSLSHQCAGIRAPSGSHFWASILFTTLCTRAFSIGLLVPHSPWSRKVVEHWDYASVANLSRSLLEVRLAFFYLCAERCSEDEWYCRWNIFNVHDCVSRIDMFTALDPSYDVRGFQEQLTELRTRLATNNFFASLPESQRKQSLNGKAAYLSPLEDIAVRAGVDLPEFRWLYKFLSGHVHGYPMSYYRMDDGGRGRGVHSPTEENYTQLFLSFATTLLTHSRDEMRSKFEDLIAEKQVSGAASAGSSAPVADDEPETKL